MKAKSLSILWTLVVPLGMLFSTSTAVGQVSDLEICKGNRKTQVGDGDLVSYAICAYNNGPGRAKDVEVEDILPPTLTSVNCGTGTYIQGTPHRCVWTIPHLPAGAGIRLEIQGIASGEGPLTNEIQITAPMNPGDPFANNTFTDSDNTGPSGSGNISASGFECRFLDWSEVVPPPNDLCRGDDGSIFADNFENGDTGAWDRTVP